MPRPDDFLPVMIAAARRAGEAALALRQGGLRVEHKADQSPVTRADRLAEEIILEALARTWPGLPVVAEEACAAGIVPGTVVGTFVLVDPIDGTREFIAGRDEFTVNIALIEGTHPVAGIVFAPASGEMFWSGPEGAFLRHGDGEEQAIRVRRCERPMVALASRSHRTPETNLFLDSLDLERVDAVGSSLKFCRVAQGAADIYPCFGPTMEWDTAAGQAVLQAAGGQVVEPDGTRLAYGKMGRADLPDFRNPFFVALGGVNFPG